MTGLRKSILLMVLYLAVVFNLEKFDYSGQNFIDMQWFVYALIIIIILSTLMIKPLKKLPVFISLVIWLVIFGLMKLAAFNVRPILSGIYTYLTITEMAVVTITVLLTHDLGRALNEFEGVIEKITLPKLGVRILRLKDADEEIKTEFIRSRRHNRPLSVMMVEIDPNTPPIDIERTVKEIQKTMMDRYMNSSLAQVLSREARRTDLILEPRNELGFILLCPETTPEGAQVLADRVQDIVLERLGVKVQIGFSSFPEEAVTFDDLLQKAYFNLVRTGDLPVYSYDPTGKIGEK